MSRYGIGNAEEMKCARLKETLAMRDAWIRKHGIKTLIEDYKMAESSSKGCVYGKT